jgi:hypothetical protein
MRTLPRVLAACFVVLGVAAVPAGASTLVKCRTVTTPTGSSGPVYESGTTCATARDVAHRFANNGRSKGWICKAFAYEGGASITCHKGTGTTQKRVRFQIAD